MFLVGILGYKIGEKIKLNKEFVDSIENYNSNEVSEENKNEQTNEVDENKEIAEKYDDNEEHDKQTYEESYDIENDYLEKEKSIGKVLTRSYDINNIDNARVVYRLSDELLNNMYQTFKNDWNKEDFDKLIESQLKWIEKKTKVEEELKNCDLVTYQTLIEMTLDKCEEWTEYYR